MIRSPLGLRLNPARSIREQILEAARLGAKGVVVDAIGDLAPDRLSATGRRDLRHLLRSAELALVALTLPTRRPFDTLDQLDDRLQRAEQACALGFDLETGLVLARLGSVPPESDAARREVFVSALRELGRRAGRQGVRLAVETGTETGSALRAVLEGQDPSSVCASIDPASLLQHAIDPVAAVRELGVWVAHAYAVDASTSAHPVALPNPRGFGFAPGVLDWEEYLGALEEIDYRGYITLWPDPSSDAAPQFTALAERLSRF
jgi:sugar phosphate isomerase/epimerase